MDVGKDCQVRGEEQVEKQLGLVSFSTGTWEVLTSALVASPCLVNSGPMDITGDLTDNTRRMLSVEGKNLSSDGCLLRERTLKPSQLWIRGLDLVIHRGQSCVWDPRDTKYRSQIINHWRYLQGSET